MASVSEFYAVMMFIIHGVLASEAWQPSPQGNQELLVVRDKVGRPQVSLE